MILRHHHIATLHPLLLFLLLINSTSAFSDYTLSSFDSTITLNLSSVCETIYTTPIQSCQPSDFNALNACSASCIQALQTLQTEAQAACQQDNVPPTSMLEYFRAGKGVDELCSVMKRLASTSTLVTTASTATSVPTTMDTGEAGEDGFSLSKGTVLAIVIAIVVAVAVLFVVGIVLYRKYYT